MVVTEEVDMEGEVMVKAGEATMMQDMGVIIHKVAPDTEEALIRTHTNQATTHTVRVALDISSKRVVKHVGTVVLVWVLFAVAVVCWTA